MTAKCHRMRTISRRAAALGAKRICQHLRGLPFRANRVLMIVVVGERSVNRGEREMRMRVDDLVRRHPQMLDFARDLADFDVGTGNDGVPARGVDIPAPGYRCGLHPGFLAGVGARAADQTVVQHSTAGNDCACSLLTPAEFAAKDDPESVCVGTQASRTVSGPSASRDSRTRSRFPRSSVRSAEYLHSRPGLPPQRESRSDLVESGRSSSRLPHGPEMCEPAMNTNSHSRRTRCR